MQTNSATCKYGPGEVCCPIFLPVGRDAKLVQEACSRHEIDTCVCDNFEQVIGAVRKGCGPVVLDGEKIDSAEWTEFLKLLASQPEWSDQPVLVLTSADNLKATETLGGGRNFAVLAKPMDEATLTSVLETEIESRRRQYQIRDLVDDLRRVNRQLDNRVQQLRHLALELTRAEEKERRQVADILHDEFQQLLAAARVNLARLEPREAGDSRDTEVIEKVNGILGQAIQASRTLCRDLSPPLLQHSGLGPALEQLAERAMETYGLQVNVEAAGDSRGMPPTLQSFLFEAARELLFNVRKHSGRNEADITLDAGDANVILAVTDEGDGFEPDRLDSRTGNDAGFGLFKLRQRAELLGGSFDLQSAPGRGTTITIAMPRNTAGASY